MAWARMLAASAAIAYLTSPLHAAEPGAVELPYRDAGLDEREAAAYLLDRLTFGARAGDVERIVDTGLDRWVAAQLTGDSPEPALDARLAEYEALRMSHAELAGRYPNSSEMSAHIRRFHLGLIPPRDEPILDFSVVSRKIDAFRELNGFRTQEGELHQQLLAQKVLRAVYAENQLREVLTDFWHNHFFTGPTSFNARLWILPYEQEALRPHALGEFRHLLGAVTRHPAMRRFYVGNEQDMAVAPEDTTMASVIAAKQAAGDSSAGVAALVARAKSEIVAMEYEEDLVLSREFWPRTGPNLEYARALVTLQTLGPAADGTAQELDGVARAFTGWTTMPVGPSDRWFARGLKDVFELGFVRDGSFLFRADHHDARTKLIFGQLYPAGGGVDEGERVLDYLAAHPSTARHLATKLAARFVAETPPKALVERLADVFERSGGDIAAVMETLIESPEFWAAARDRTKVKTPLEYVASALRATDAEVEAPQAAADWIARMGQPLYAYLEPTGYPDDGEYWLDPASLLQRVAFAEALAVGDIAGIAIDPSALVRDTAAAPNAADVAARILPGRTPADALASLDLAALQETSNLQGRSDRLAALTALVIASPEFQLR